MAQLAIGDQAPDFEAVTDQGTTIHLHELQGKRVILYFYPKDDTSGCTTQACGFRDRYLEITEKNGIVLGVSNCVACQVRTAMKREKAGVAKVVYPAE